MILVDANLLIYAHVSSFREHERSKQWLDTALSGTGKVGLPWPSLLGFARLVTNPRVLSRPLQLSDAWRQIQHWLSADCAWSPGPTDRHQDILARLWPEVTNAGLIADAHLAAIAIEHGLVLASNDGDFARFSNLQWINPLADRKP